MQELKSLQKTVLDYLRDVALSGMPCPSNTAIAEAVGAPHKRAVASAMHGLIDQQLFTVRRIGLARQIIFPDGVETASPEDEIGDIVAKAAVIFGVRTADIVGPSHLRQFVRPRFSAIAVASEAGYSTKTIGAVLARDHSSVVHAINTHAIYAERSDEYRSLTDELRYAAGLVPAMALAA